MVFGLLHGDCEQCTPDPEKESCSERMVTLKLTGHIPQRLDICVTGFRMDKKMGNFWT